MRYLPGLLETNLLSGYTVTKLHGFRCRYLTIIIQPPLHTSAKLRVTRDHQHNGVTCRPYGTQSELYLDTRTKLCTLLGEFETFKTDLDCLRSKGGEIIRDSPDPEEKQTVQKALAEVNRQWLSLQQVVKEVPSNQDKVTALGAMVKQLQQTCSAPNSTARVLTLKQKLDTVQTKAGLQLSSLEDANQRLSEFEREVSELMRWLEQTRARMTMRDTTTDLRSQLDVQEVRHRERGWRRMGGAWYAGIL
ncbi:nesprin-1-like [Elysia marginata]|uniref:Nesprin-1-like n=1 Tax=Elysia marginata TaxID=1093978 RepID=A0AAV4GHD8_9GAST|nr:nesprin-1-like [Elysia marginata]